MTQTIVKVRPHIKRCSFSPKPAVCARDLEGTLRPGVFLAEAFHTGDGREWEDCPLPYSGRQVRDCTQLFRI